MWATVKVRGQLGGAGSLLPPLCGFWKLYPRDQACPGSSVTGWASSRAFP